MSQVKSKQQQLLDIIDNFLLIYCEEIYYKELTQILIDSESWIPYGQKPDQIVYSALHQDIKRNGNASAFRFLGSGLFITARAPGVEAVAITLPPLTVTPRDPLKRKPGENEADVERRREHITSNSCCGNCAYISFSAKNEYSMEIGECAMWPGSGRHCTKPSASPCEFWDRASVAQMETRSKRREELRTYLIKNGYLSPSDKDRDVVMNFIRKRQDNATR